MEKKFRLSSTNKILGGVCGGVSEYFGVDLNIVRVAFLLLAIFGSLGIWAYLLLWIFAPKA
jgi:phage shock protein PspC (stress-responsive transcriptional regulator)